MNEINNINPMPTPKKKPVKLIAIIVAAVIVVIAAVIGITMYLEASKYLKIVNAYENTLNAESMKIELEIVEDEEFSQNVFEVEVIGKGDDTIASVQGDRYSFVAIDKDHIYYNSGNLADIHEQENYEVLFNSLAERDVNGVYNYLGIDEVLDMSFDELYDACIGFVKDYYNDESSINVECDVEDDEDSYEFEINLCDFIEYIEDNNDYRMDHKLFKEIPEEALLVIELQLDGEYIEEFSAALEYEHFYPFKGILKFSDVNDISKKNNDVKKYINEFVESEE